MLKSDCFEIKIIQNIYNFALVFPRNKAYTKGMFIHKKIKHQMSMKLVRNKEERTDSKERQLLASPDIWQVLETGLLKFKVSSVKDVSCILNSNTYVITYISRECIFSGFSLYFIKHHNCGLSKVQPEHRSHGGILFICDISWTRYWTKPDYPPGLSSVSTLCIIMV